MPSSSINLSIFLEIKGISLESNKSWSNPSLIFSNSLSHKSILFTDMGENFKKSLIIPPIKLFTKDLHKLRKVGEKYFFKEREVNKIELCGFIYNISDYKFNIIDFYGETECHTRIIIPEDQFYNISCKLLDSKIICMSAKKVNYYEEIFYWLEANEFSKFLKN